MRYNLIIFAVGAVLLAGCQRETPNAPATAPAAPAANAPQPPAPAKAAALPHAFKPAIDAGDFAEQVKILASDEFEGRGPGSNGERRTTEYLVEQLKRIGAKPGNGESWFQAVPMVEITSSPETRLDLVFDDGKTETLAYGDDMVVGSRQTRPEAGIKDSEMVFVGYGINAPEQNWNDYAGLDVKGKTVVMLVNDPDFDVADGAETPFKGRTMTYYGRWTYKYEEAARQGAAAALIVHETKAASYGWEVVYNSWSGPQYDLPSSEDPSPKVEIQGWLSGPAAERVFTAAGLNLAEQIAAAKQRGFKPVSLKAKASATIKNRIREATSNNVVGVIQGSERPDEYVLYMGHWDHLGRTFSAPGGDAIFNGAVDNATGVAGVLEIGEAFAAQNPKPKRSVILLLVTLEESGLLGSRYYAEHPLFPLEKTAAVINLDAMSVIGPSKDVVVVGYGNSVLDDYLAEAVAPQQRTVEPEPTPENGYYFRSDHFNFAKKGVPALYAKGGPNHAEKGIEYGQAQAADYTAQRYHKPADEFDANWDLRGVVQDLDALYAVGRRIADESTWPAWDDASEFSAPGKELAVKRQ
jgi:Zn-dependent M28 family amino/carboxypeptidase